MEREAERMMMNIATIDALSENLSEDTFPVESSLREVVLHQLTLLKASLMDPPEDLVADGSMKEVESMASNAVSIISCFDLKGMDQDMALQLCDLVKTTLSNLLSLLIPSGGSMQSLLIASGGSRLDRVTVEEQFRDLYPKTDQIGFIDNLVENLDYLAKAKPGLVGPLKLYILKLQSRLQLMSSCLKEIPEARKEEADLEDLMTGITNLAHEVEYAIDAFLVKLVPAWYAVQWLNYILKKFDKYWDTVQMACGEAQSIVRNIIACEGKTLQFIPILNLSPLQHRQVFNHHNIVHTFWIGTWGSVSSYKGSKKEFFLQLLQNTAYRGTYLDFGERVLWHASYAPYVPHGDNLAYTCDTNENELEILVDGLLSRGPYFIILEDVPDIDVLREIRRILPETHRRCRILVSARSPELVAECRHGFRKLFANKMTTKHTSKSPIVEDNVVGFKAETKAILEGLIRGPAKLQIISIVGMPGQGKTTLAKKLYDHCLIVEYFHTRAWYYVSHLYNKRELLLGLLGQFVQPFDTINHKNDQELAEVLYKYLKGRRFLIVLDDMWQVDAWKDLSRCFPNDNNGSRIVFTTRIKELASQAKSDSTLQSLYPLSDAESWELLKKKVFHNDSCPSELLEVGKQIANSCKGLPLAVVLAAGCLLKMEKEKASWEQIAESLTSSILHDAKGNDVIELSYKNLPDHLKSCFLYYGVLLGGKEISVSELIRFWIAEGFIAHTKAKSLEDVAEDYLRDLISRSLVTISQEKSKGGVKSCYVHDLLREFCLTKAEKENFLLVEGSDFDSSYNLRSIVQSYNSSRLSNLRERWNNPRRKYFTSLKRVGSQFSQENPYIVRSLLVFAAEPPCPNYLYDMLVRFEKFWLPCKLKDMFKSEEFRFLRILKLETTAYGNCFEEIKVLILLRYLEVIGPVDFIPSFIANLWNLETFLVKGLSAKVTKVSDSIWDMAKLRHLHINDRASFDLKPYRLENSSILGNLQTFSTPTLAYGDDTGKILRRLCGIRKLKCIFLDSWDDATICNRFPEFGNLNQLVSLNVFYDGKVKYPCEFNIPSNLKKLTLSNFRMPWNEVSQLATLCNLEVLKLLANTIEGELWEMEEEVFPKLRFLKLETLNVVEWRALADHFPCLEHILVHKCEQLEAIPPSFGDIPTLLMIEVMWCNPSAAISTKRILEEQLDFGNEALKVRIHPKISDMESSSLVDG